jgi:hypothetical protein
MLKNSQRSYAITGDRSPSPGNCLFAPPSSDQEKIRRPMKIDGHVARSDNPIATPIGEQWSQPMVTTTRHTSTPDRTWGRGPHPPRPIGGLAPLSGAQRPGRGAVRPLVGRCSVTDPWCVAFVPNELGPVPDGGCWPGRPGTTAPGSWSQLVRWKCPRPSHRRRGG